MKKILGLTTYADDMAHLNQTWVQGNTILSTISKALTGLGSQVGQLFGNVASVASTVPGVTKVASVATSVVTSTTTAVAAAGSTAAAVKATVITHGAYVTKVGALLSAVAVTAQSTIDTVETVDKRVKQARAVATDTLRHPINLDRALNPAYHGKRKQMDQAQKLTADYYRGKLGENYEVTPLLGYGAPDLPKPTYRHLKLTSLVNGKEVTLEDTILTPQVNLIDQLDPEELIQLTKAEELKAEFLVNLVDEEVFDPFAIDLVKQEVFIDDEQLLEFAIAQEYIVEEIQAEFEEDVGGYWVEGEASLLAPEPTTELAEHGIEFFEITGTRSSTRTVVTFDGPSPYPDMNGHFAIIQILGEETFTETFKQTASRETSTKYLKTLFSGNTNVGPATYVHSLEPNDIRRVIVNSVASKTNYARLVDEYIKKVGFSFRPMRKKHLRRIAIRRPRNFR